MLPCLASARLSRRLGDLWLAAAPILCFAVSVSLCSVSLRSVSLCSVAVCRLAVFSFPNVISASPISQCPIYSATRFHANVCRVFRRCVRESQNVAAQNLAAQNQAAQNQAAQNQGLGATAGQCGGFMNLSNRCYVFAEERSPSDFSHSFSLSKRPLEMSAVAPAESSTTTKSDSDIIIETRNLGKIYRDFWGRPKVQALESLDIEVRRGEIFGLLGPNGSGKSTTIKLIQGLLFPSTGRAFVFGKDARDVSKNERIGYLPEESYLYKFLNAEETLDFYGRLFDMPADIRRQRTDQLIQMVGLKGARRQQLREYSKGMTRRIGLAQALINEPDLLILDEPTSGLDPIGSREMKDLILRLRDQGKTILMCSHQLADVQDVCDRIAILHRGRLRELGRVDDLLKVREITEVHAKGLTPEVQAKIAELIKSSGAELVSMDNPTTTMEELFLEIVRESEARPGMRTSASAQAPRK